MNSTIFWTREETTSVLVVGLLDVERRVEGGNGESLIDRKRQAQKRIGWKKHSFFRSWHLSIEIDFPISRGCQESERIPRVHKRSQSRFKHWWRGLTSAFSRTGRSQAEGKDILKHFAFSTPPPYPMMSRLKFECRLSLGNFSSAFFEIILCDFLWSGYAFWAADYCGSRFW